MKKYNECSKEELIDLIVDLKLNLNRKKSLVNYYTRMLAKANERIEKQKQQIFEFRKEILTYKIKGNKNVKKKHER